MLEIGKSTYQFIFPCEMDVIRILNVMGSPNPVHLQREVGLKLGAKIGFVDYVAIPATGSKEGRYVRVRVHLNVLSPLKRGCMVKLGSCPAFWVEFRYERLPTLCHYCGLVGHELLDCESRFFDIEENTLQTAQYGAWIRASPATQPGRKKPASPAAGPSSDGEPDKGMGDDFGLDGDSQSNLAILKSPIFSGNAGKRTSKVDDVAHAEMLAELRYREKNPECLHLSGPSHNEISPIGEKALHMWRAKNPLRPTSTQSTSPNISPDPNLAHPSNKPIAIPSPLLTSPKPPSAFYPTALTTISKLYPTKTDPIINLKPPTVPSNLSTPQPKVTLTTQSPSPISVPSTQIIPNPLTSNLSLDLALVDTPILVDSDANPQSKGKPTRRASNRKGIMLKDSVSLSASMLAGWRTRRHVMSLIKLGQLQFRARDHFLFSRRFKLADPLLLFGNDENGITLESQLQS
ncbi:hypothetical protein C3L33_23237, partial [Rhododendron williamsianum]